MEEVKHGIFLLGIGFVAVRGIDGKTTAVAEDLAVVPRMAHGSVLGCLHVVLGAFSGDEKHWKITGSVTLYHDILGVVHGHSVHYEIVCVDLRPRERDLDGPDIVLTAGHVDGTSIWIGHPGAAEFHYGCIICLKTECDAVALYFGRDDGSGTTGEICQFLCLYAGDDGEQGDDGE